jgi:hypothetical protein
MRYFGVLHADAESEAGAPPSPELFEKMGAFVEEAAKAGVLEATNGLHPSSKAVRFQVTDGKVTVTDGPFAETKELVASYAVMNVGSKEELTTWVTRFLEILGTGTCDCYQVYEPEDFPPEVFSPEAQAQEARIRDQLDRNTQA